MRMPGALVVPLLLALAGAAGHALAANADDGWQAVPSSRAKPVSAPLGEAIGRGQAGDRMHIVEAGDTLAQIAQRHTGNRDNAQTLARYNGVGMTDTLREGRMLLVPAKLLLEPGAAWGSAQREAASVVFERRVAAEPVDAYRSAAEPVPDHALADVVAPTEVLRKNLDLFAGQVKVLGHVDVNRVAVGNGSIVRTEILNTGELLVIAEQAGSSSLRLWHNDGRQTDYNLRVSSEDPETRVRMERMVRMRVRMVEFRKSALSRLGIDWSQSVTGPTLATAGDVLGNSLYRPAADGFAASLPTRVQPFSSYFGIASQITSRINLLAATGDAVMLAEPVLSCASGGTANFLAGGEVPYPSIGANGRTTVDFKEYGIKLEISPVIDPGGNVQTQVLTEVSQIDPSVSVGGAPGLLTRRTQTQVNVLSGQTIVLSGLLSSENSEDLNALPGIGKLPILGAFFKSTSRRKTVSELVVFITPEVVEPGRASADTHQQQLYRQAGQRLDQARGGLRLMD